jgi:hypothetical protein
MTVAGQADGGEPALFAPPRRRKRKDGGGGADADADATATALTLAPAAAARGGRASTSGALTGAPRPPHPSTITSFKDLGVSDWLCR